MMIKTTKIYLLLILTALVSFSCAKEEVRPSADSLMTQNVLGVLETIKHGYEKKDSAVIEKRMSPDLAKNTLDEFTFETAELTFSPRMVKIDAGSDITVKLIWRGTWVIGSETLKDRGIGTLTFDKDTFNLMNIEGNNPFRTPRVK